MLTSPQSGTPAVTSKQRMEREQEEKEQLSTAAGTVHAQETEAEQRHQRSVPAKRTLLVRRLPATAHSQPTATQPALAQSAAVTVPPAVEGRRRVLLLKRPDEEESKQSLPPISRHSAKPHSTTAPQPANGALASPHVPSAALSSIRERRILARVAASSTAFSAFQSLLAARVQRPAGSLCMTNASDEYRVRMERAAINEHEKRIARQAAAAHIDAQLTAADEEGGLALPWEQSLRGATNHSVGVGGLFSGLYCKITQADMKEMEIVRSVKMMEEQPSLSTQPRARRPGRPALTGEAHQSAAAARLVDEAARLQQLSRLGTLGSKEPAHRRQQPSEQTAAAEQDEATLRLGDLIVRGTALFDCLDPPPPPPAPSTAAAAGSHVELAAAVHTTAESGADEAESGPLPLSFVLSCSSLSFQQAHFPADKQSAHLTLHNPTASTLHFALSRLCQQSAFDACTAPLPARPSFVLSHSTGHVLPLASIELCATFAPPAAGLWVERWQLAHVDQDGESQPLAAAVLTLTGSSHPPPARHSSALASQSIARGDSLLTPPSLTQRQQPEQDNAVLSPFFSSSSSSSSSAAVGFAGAALRAAFCSANGDRRLHFHRWLMPQWWRLWHDVRQLHRPLDRQRMEWQLSARHLQAAIEQLPRRHSQRQSALRGRLDELQALAAVQPRPHPARTALLASLLTALSAALPPFGCQLRLVHKLSLPPPWEGRARAKEREMMEWEDSLPRMTDEQRHAAMELRRKQQQEEAELEDPPQQQQQPGDGQAEEEVGQPATVVSDAELVKRREEAARVRGEEQRADADWRQRHSEYQQRLEEESRRVLAAVISAFEAQAGMLGSDEAPPDAEKLSAEAEQQVQLPVAFPTLTIEPEPEAEQKGKGKAGKAKR